MIESSKCISSLKIVLFNHQVWKIGDQRNEETRRKARNPTMALTFRTVLTNTLLLVS